MFRIVRGAIRFFSERYGGRPFVDCLICAFMVLLRFMGMYVKDGDQKTIRAAMPGQPKAGTSIAQNMAALRSLNCPTLPHVGGVADADMLAALKIIGGSKRGKTAFVVHGRNQDLPRDSKLRRVTGVNYVGLHAITIVAKSEDGDFLYCINPMGRDAAHPPKPTPDDWHPYTGTLEPTVNVLAFVSRTKTGKIAAAFGTYNEAKA